MRIHSFWLFICLLGISSLFAGPFNTNLLVNPGFETGSFDSWTETNGGSGWSFEGGRTSLNGIVSSYQLCTISQTIDLLSAGFTESELDAGGYLINWSAWVQAVWGGKYFIQFAVKDASNNTIFSQDHNTPSSLGVLPNETQWFLDSDVIWVDTPGARSITIYIGGMDTRNWNYWFGTKFDDVSVSLVPNADYLEESGTNDSQGMADAIPTGDHVASVQGEVTSPSTDWYSYHVYQGNELWVNIESGSVDVELYDSNSNLIGTQFGTTSGTMTYHYTASESLSGLQLNWMKVTSAGGRGVYAIHLFNESANTLPVELTGFLATQTTGEFVSLAWSTASECDMLGYNILRATSDNLSAAVVVNPQTLEAANSLAAQTYTFRDNYIEAQTHYWYWLEAISLSGQSEHYGPVAVFTNVSDPDPDDTPDLDKPTALLGNFPNPFNPSTEICYRLAEAGNVRIDIFDLRGRQVAHYESEQSAGQHTQTWAPNNSGSGIYLIRFHSGDVEQVSRAILMK